ncbi:hypothetical protein [Solirubrobacter soli]|uniref:hypothetical protein n=1 Tax=Solirubrobacter soli TaxID=363832 RepID=UPI0003F67382|nr:hypothetical protein [Solirubrobacter soli]
MKRTIKLAAEAFKPANLARGLRPASSEDVEAVLEAATPEQRAAYLAQVERAEAAARDAQSRDEARRVLFGPAGSAVHGPTIDEQQGASLRFARVEFRRTVRQVVGRPEVPQIEDPVQRAHHAAAARAARDQARAPYRGPHAVPIHVSRLTTRGKTQLDQVLGYLNASGLAPDRIFGVYRVPDRISQAVTPHSEKGRPVEWDVVHSDPHGTSAPFVATAFAAEEQWVARRVGEPSVLDEELALAFCLSAGIGPEHCAGIARVSEFRALHDGDADGMSPVCTLVRGVVAVHPRTDSDAYERMRAAAPLLLHEPTGIHVEILNWAAIAAAVHTRATHPPPVPSPFPYLPATPQELLRAYLEVVGVRPEDSYSAQATVDGVRMLGGAHTNLGPKQPCADGKDRMRAHGCQLVVLVYRDRPEYVAGRERWAAYAGEQLHAKLERGTGIPRRVESNEPGRLERAAELLERLHWDNWFDGLDEEPIPYRYCWPPIR